MGFQDGIRLHHLSGRLVFSLKAVGLFSADKTFIGANDLLSLH